MPNALHKFLPNVLAMFSVYASGSDQLVPGWPLQKPTSCHWQPCELPVKWIQVVCTLWFTNPEILGLYNQFNIACRKTHFSAPPHNVIFFEKKIVKMSTHLLRSCITYHWKAKFLSNNWTRTEGLFQKNCFTSYNEEITISIVCEKK